MTQLQYQIIEPILIGMAQALQIDPDEPDAEFEQRARTTLRSIAEHLSSEVVQELATEVVVRARSSAHSGSDSDRDLTVRMVSALCFAMGLEVDAELVGLESLDPTFDSSPRVESERFVQPDSARGPIGETGSDDQASTTDWISGVDQDFAQVFVGQHTASLEALEVASLNIERTGPEADVLDEIRRVLHTLKGDAGLVGLGEVERRAHNLEDEIDLGGNDIAGEVLDFVDWLRQGIRIMSGEAPPPAVENTADVAPATDLDQDKFPACKITCDEDIASEFVTESYELLESIELLLLKIESDRNDAESVNAVFRAFHTIKGVASFLELDHIKDLAHETESLLDRVRSQTIEMGEAAFEATLAAFDQMKVFVSDVQTGISGDGSLPAYPGLGLLLDRIIAVRSGQTPVPIPTPNVAKEEASTGAAAPQPGRSSGTAQETIRVEPGRLDRLVDAIGELVIAESMVTKALETETEATPQVGSHVTHLRKITRELQEMAMSLRMVPLRSTFRRMARLTRDVAKKLNKRIDFEAIGEDAELDKTVVDAIGDPLLHMVRNAVDHGLEKSAEERRAAGKSEVGKICLRAFHEGGSIFIAVSDDGAGMDRDAILGKAIERGVIRDGDNLSDSEVFSLVFEPGFSTAAEVSEVSGRGVGLDVVKRTIEDLRGHIEVRSERGAGTEMRMKLPLTLAIIDGMIVRVGDQRFVIPTLDIVRIIQRSEAKVTNVYDRSPVLQVGEDLIPLIDVGKTLCMFESDTQRSSAMVVVDSGDKTVALAVDELIGQHQIVIKNVGTALDGARGFAGGAIMPDGRVSLILDVVGLLNDAPPVGSPQPA